MPSLDLNEDEEIQDIKSKAAKFNMSFLFLEHLNNLIRIGDQCYSNRDFIGWADALILVYRNISGFMDDKEKEFSLKFYNAISQEKNIHENELTKINIRRERERKEGRYKLTPMRQPPYSFQTNLHRFDLMLKRVMYKHKLLIPEKSSGGSAIMQ